MTAVAELTRTLIAGGMDPADAAALVARAGAEMCVVAPSKGALRTRKWRANRPSQTVTKRHSVTPSYPPPEASPNVTERHKPSPRDAAHISTISSLDPIKEKPREERKKEAPPSKRGSRIPDDWQLGQREIDYALSKGIARERIPILGEKFKNHFMAASGKGSVSPNWFLKWCTWCLNEVEWNGTRNGHRQTNPDRSTSAAAGRLLEKLREFDAPLDRS